MLKCVSCTTFVTEIVDLHERNLNVSIQIWIGTLQSEEYRYIHAISRCSVQNEEEMLYAVVLIH
jgi:hypothetical protein